MKVIIAGSRTILDYELVKTAIEESGFDITEVISGTASGVDKLGEAWAHNNRIPVRRFKPDYMRFGRGAPLKRNTGMADYADALIAVWDNFSTGTLDMINKAKARKLPVHIRVE